MKINASFINHLRSYFIPKRGNSAIAGNLIPAENETYNLGSATKKFDTIYVRNLVADVGSAGGISADMVDGFHASASPQPNNLLALDGDAQFPDYVHNSVARTITARHTFNPGLAQSPFILGPNAQGMVVAGLRADEVDKHVSAGAGLKGGGKLVTNITLDIQYSGVGSQIEAGVLAAQGVSEFPSRSDHIHNILTGSPRAIKAGQSDSDGVSSALARADHLHSILTGTPLSLSVSSINAEGSGQKLARANHTHAIISSSNPGVSASILATNSLGEIFLGGDFRVDTDTLVVDVSEDAVYINAGTLPNIRGALTIKPATTTQKGLVLQRISGQTERLFSIYDEAGNDLIIITNDGDLESGNPGFVSGLTGWQIAHDGTAEFWNVFVRGELHSSVFVADELHATGGSLAVITTSRVVKPQLAADNILPALNQSFYLNLQASWDLGLSYFTDCDVIRLKFMGDPGSGLDLYDVYVQVIGEGTLIGRDIANGNPGYYRTLAVRRSGGATGLEIPIGIAAVKWGETSGSGYSGAILLTSDLNYAPYIDVFTIDNWTTYAPWNPLALKPRVRVGNLDGLPNQSEQWGIAFGTDLSDSSRPYGIFSDLKAELHGISISMWDSGGNIRGKIDPTATGSGFLFWLGQSASDWRLAFDANYNLRLRGTQIIGPNQGYVTSTALIYCPFDGPGEPFKDWTVSWQSKTGIRINQTGNPNGCPGKFNKAIQIAGSATNLIVNPSWETTTANWTFADSGTGGQYIRVSGQRYLGNYSARILKGTGGNARIYAGPFTLPNGQYAHAFVRARTASGGGVGTLYIRLGASGTIVSQMSTSSNNVWEPLHVTYQNTTGSDITNLYVQLVSSGGDNTYAWFDACSLEIKTSNIQTPYLDGSLGPGHAWTGTAHASTSTRQASSLLVSGDQLRNPDTFSISAWVKLEYNNGNAGYIIQWMMNNNNFVAVHITQGGFVRARVMIAGTNDPDITGAKFVTDDQWHHVVAVFESVASGNAKVTLYVDGFLEGTDTSASSALNLEGYPIGIGSTAVPDTRLNGLLDDFLLIPQVLTQDDVTLIYESGSPIIFLSNTFETTWLGLDRGRVWASSDGIYGESADGDASFALVNVDNISWGGLSVNKGDLVIGHNKSGSTALLWDKSAGVLEFFANTQSVLKLDADGSIYFHTDQVKISSASGLELRSYSSSRAIRLQDAPGGDILRLTAGVGGGSGEWYASISAPKSGSSVYSNILYIDVGQPSGSPPQNNGQIYISGEVVVAANTSTPPTGGGMGRGTINAKGVYDDSSLLTDFVFEPGYRLLSIPEMASFFRERRHLPTIPGKDEWERVGRFSLGALSNYLWETVEVQAIYIAEIEERLRKIEETLT